LPYRKLAARHRNHGAGPPKEFAAHAGDGRAGNELLSETDRVRLWAIGLKPGKRLGFHTHVLDYFWTSVTAGHGRGRVASVADPAIFKSGRDLAAWIEFVPWQNSSGDKERLGGITKVGNGYLRQMLMVGAMAVIRYAQRNSTRRPWLVQFMGRHPTKVAAIALANKTARTVWALMSSGEHYRDPQAMQATVSPAA
jgi:hypothetical protein